MDINIFTYIEIKGGGRRETEKERDGAKERGGYSQLCLAGTHGHGMHNSSWAAGGPHALGAPVFRLPGVCTRACTTLCGRCAPDVMVAWTGTWQNAKGTNGRKITLARPRA